MKAKTDRPHAVIIGAIVQVGNAAHRLVDSPASVDAEAASVTSAVPCAPTGVLRLAFFTARCWLSKSPNLTRPPLNQYNQDSKSLITLAGK